MWATAPRQPSTRCAVSPTVSDPVKSAVGATTTCAAGSSSRSHATRGNVHSGVPVSFQDRSQANDPAWPVSPSGPTRTPAVSNQAAPAAGWVGSGPNRSVRGGPSRRKPGHPAVRVGAAVVSGRDRLAVNPQAGTSQRIRQGGVPDFQAPGVALPARGRGRSCVACPRVPSGLGVPRLLERLRVGGVHRR